jgi:hypothetical protein
VLFPGLGREGSGVCSGGRRCGKRAPMGSWPSGSVPFPWGNGPTAGGGWWGSGPWGRHGRRQAVGTSALRAMPQAAGRCGILSTHACEVLLGPRFRAMPQAAGRCGILSTHAREVLLGPRFRAMPQAAGSLQAGGG